MKILYIYAPKRNFNTIFLYFYDYLKKFVYDLYIHFMKVFFNEHIF